MNCQKTWVEAFVQERNEALYSLDKEKIMAYCKKYSVPIPDNDEVFWVGVHKAIVHITSAPEPIRERSLVWLSRRGYSPEIK